MMRKSIWFIPIFGVPVVYGLLVAYHNVSIGNGFDKVTKGASPEFVLSLMGEPDVKNESCENSRSWLGEPVADQKCSVEYLYYAKLKPMYWTIGFSDDRAAVMKYEHVSP